MILSIKARECRFLIANLLHKFKCYMKYHLKFIGCSIRFMVRKKCFVRVSEKNILSCINSTMTFSNIHERRRPELVSCVGMCLLLMVSAVAGKANI